MAPLPKRRHSSARQAKRTHALKLQGVTLSKCSNCKELKHPHSVCGKCGFYSGRLVIAQKEKKNTPPNSHA